MLSTLFVFSSILHTAVSTKGDGTFWKDDLPDEWHTAGSCYNLETDCKTTMAHSDEHCRFCYEDCNDGTEYDATWCGDIERTDCDRVVIQCLRLCEAYNRQCQYDWDNRFIEGNLCKSCVDECDPYWRTQCELKQNYDNNDGLYSYDATKCLDHTAFPEPGAEACCSTLVHEDAVNECAVQVDEKCEDVAYDCADEGDYDAMDLILEQCDCYFETNCDDFPRACHEREECEAIGQSSALFTVNLPVTPTEMVGAIVAGALLTVAALLCCVVCLRSMCRSKTVQYGKVGASEVDTDSESEQLKR